MTHIGILGDERLAASIPENERCKCCGGTGNMLYAMYFKCLACNGDGKTRGAEAESMANEAFNYRFKLK